MKQAPLIEMYAKFDNVSDNVKTTVTSVDETVVAEVESQAAEKEDSFVNEVQYQANSDDISDNIKATVTSVDETAVVESQAEVESQAAAEDSFVNVMQYQAKSTFDGEISSTDEDDELYRGIDIM